MAGPIWLIWSPRNKMSKDGVKIPKCSACQLGKQERTPKGGSTIKKSQDGILKREKLKPGELIFLDQFESSLPGRVFNERGWQDFIKVDFTTKTKTFGWITVLCLYWKVKWMKKSQAKCGLTRHKKQWKCLLSSPKRAKHYKARAGLVSVRHWPHRSTPMATQRQQ